MRKVIMIMTSVCLLASQNGWSEPAGKSRLSDPEINSEVRNKAYVHLGIGILALAVSVPLAIAGKKIVYIGTFMPRSTAPARW